MFLFTSKTQKIRKIGPGFFNTFDLSVGVVERRSIIATDIAYVIQDFFHIKDTSSSNKQNEIILVLT